MTEAKRPVLMATMRGAQSLADLQWFVQHCRALGMDPKSNVSIAYPDNIQVAAWLDDTAPRRTLRVQA